HDVALRHPLNATEAVMSEPLRGWEPERARRPLAEERRASVRYASTASAICRPIGDARVGPWQARLRDISTLGAGLVLPYRPEPGHLLELEIVGTRGAVRRGLARPCHV